jgi:hypothetical protein
LLFQKSNDNNNNTVTNVDVSKGSSRFLV